MRERKLVLFDLDQTLIDSRKAREHRQQRQWTSVYQMIPELPLYEGIGGLWSDLCNQCYTLGVVTSSPSSYCHRVLDHWGLEPQVTVCYHDTSRHKPHPAPLLEALRRADMPPSNALYVGDAPSDMKAAQAAKILDIGALWGTAVPGLLHQIATRVAPSPDMIRNWFIKCTTTP